MGYLGGVEERILIRTGSHRYGRNGGPAPYTWLTALVVFLDLLTLRLNMSMVVSWFVDLVPVWIYDGLRAIKLFKKDSLEGTAVFQRAFYFPLGFSRDLLSHRLSNILMLQLITHGWYHHCES